MLSAEFVVSCAAALFAGGGGTFTMLPPVWAAVRSRKWIATEGRVMATRLQFGADFINEGVNTGVQRHIRYQYVVGAQTLTGTRPNFVGYGLFYTNPPLAPYSAGQRLTVWYDPLCPEESVLDRRVSRVAILALLFSLALLALGVVGAGSLLLTVLT